MIRLPVKCACHSNFSIDHAFSYHLGGFTTQRHNNIRDLVGDLLKEVCHDVEIEPTLLMLLKKATTYQPHASKEMKLELMLVPEDFGFGIKERFLM